MGFFDLLFGKGGGNRTLANTGQDEEKQNPKKNNVIMVELLFHN